MCGISGVVPLLSTSPLHRVEPLNGPVYGHEKVPVLAIRGPPLMTAGGPRFWPLEVPSLAEAST